MKKENRFTRILYLIIGVLLLFVGFVSNNIILVVVGICFIILGIVFNKINRKGKSNSDDSAGK